MTRSTLSFCRHLTRACHSHRQAIMADSLRQQRSEHPQKMNKNELSFRNDICDIVNQTASSGALIFTAWGCAICSLYYWLCKRRVWEGVAEFVWDYKHLAPHHCADGFLPVRSLSGVDTPGKLWHDIVFFRVPSRPQAPEGRGEGMGYIEREREMRQGQLIDCELNGYSLLCGCLWELRQRSWEEYQTGSVTAKMTRPQCKAVN